MTGPENYREAEKLLDAAENTPMGSDEERYYLGAAQVHATLALAAATALNAPLHDNTSTPDELAWHEVSGVKPEDGAQ
ncbi:hypothetical protein [Streptosporangium canum]|uniref:hypothetical protein n=1 Tax=Streptosporangium canum TaxID=324952 RepID=UPI0033BCE1C0